MPTSAIAAGVVDFVLSPSAIAKQLAALARHPYLSLKPSQEPDSEKSLEPSENLNGIFDMLRSLAGIDFSLYKQNTILRRIERRMALHGLNDLKEYSRRLRNNPAEANILAQEL